MSTKNLVLELLEKNRGQSLSGEYMASQLHVSRNVVWRAIKALQKDGYEIEAVTNKGYTLLDNNDIISAEGIRPYLFSEEISHRIQVYSELDSTNKTAKQMAVDSSCHGTIIIADRQTSGKGRYGRDFFSPAGSGLYISFILHPDHLGFSAPTAITAFAGVCVCEAVEAVCHLVPSIKWVNDIFLKGKKVGGILTEAISDFESGGIQDVILGIGINVSTAADNFPDDLKNIASSLYPDGKPEITRSRLAAEIINRITRPDGCSEAELFEGYKKRLFMLGSQVVVKRGSEEYEALALDIDSQGQLIVQKQDGRVETLNSGEIRISLT